MHKTLNLGLTSSFISVVLEGEVNGSSSTLELELREMTSAERDAHMDYSKANLEFQPDGKIRGLKKFDGVQAALIARCLFYKGTENRVPLAEIQKWPARTVQALFDAARGLNGLDTEEDGKNPDKGPDKALDDAKNG